MRTTTLMLPQVGLIAATRGMLGAGAALLLADKVPKERRKAVAIPLLAIGILSTVPLVISVWRKSKPSEAEPPVPDASE